MTLLQENRLLLQTENATIAGLNADLLFSPLLLHIFFIHTCIYFIHTFYIL